MFHLLFLVAILIITYSCLRYSIKLYNRRKIYQNHGINIALLFLFIIMLWFVLLPTISIAAPLFRVKSEILIFNTYYGTVISYAPIILLGKLLSKKLKRNTASANEAGLLVKDAIWFCYYVIGFHSLIIILSFGSYL